MAAVPVVAVAPVVPVVAAVVVAPVVPAEADVVCVLLFNLEFCALWFIHF